MKKFRILAIDGGGMRLVMTLEVLKYIEKRTGKPIHEMFDLIAGTSAGSFIALGLAKPKPSSAKEIQQMFIEGGPIIFPKSSALSRIAIGFTASAVLGGVLAWIFYRQSENLGEKVAKRAIYSGIVGGLFNYACNFYGFLRSLFKPTYPESGRKKVLQMCCGDAKMKEAITHVMVSAHCTETNKTTFLTKTKAEAKPKWNCYMWMACLLSSAAPTYFPLCEFAGKTYIDGGVTCNNPTRHAYKYAREKLAIKKEEMVIVSLGSGFSKKDLGFTTTNREMGMLHWLLKHKIITMMLKGVGPHEDLRMQKKKLKNYYRIDSFFKESIGLDETSPHKIMQMKRRGKELVKKYKEVIDGEIIPRIAPALN